MRVIRNSVCAVVTAFLLAGGHFAAVAQDPKPAPTVVAPEQQGVQNNAFTTLDYTFSDWQVQCVLQKMRDKNNIETGTTRLVSCASKEDFKDANGNDVLIFGASYEKVEGKVNEYPSIYFQAPLGVFLEPIYIRVDGKDPSFVPYRFCTTRGCVAAVALDQQHFQQFKRGGKAEIGYILQPTQEPYIFDLSLRGFVAATNFMKAAMQKAGNEVTKADLDALRR